MTSVSCLSRHKAFTSLELHIASRLSMESSLSKTVLLQMSSAYLCAQFVRAGWLAGWCVAVVNAEATKTQVATVKEKLGNCLFIQSCSEKEAFVHGDDAYLDTWLASSPKIDIPPRDWSEEECALILFTSGTTGSPKGVCHSLGNILRSAELYVDHFELTPNDTLICLAPFHAVSGIRSLVISFFCKTHVEFLQPGNFLQLITQLGRYESSHILCGPVFVKQLAAYGRRVEPFVQHLKAIHCTGVDLDEQDRAAVEKILSIPVLNYYGLTETTGLALAEKIGNRRSGYLPPPCAGISVETFNADSCDDLQHLVLNSPNLFLGYLGDDLSRRKSFITGDLVKEPERGVYTLYGRSSGLVKAPSTEWIHPGRLESWLRCQLKEADCLVKPVKIPGGYAFNVSIDAESDFSIQEIEDRIATELGADYLPCGWDHVCIERNALGKVTRIEPINSGK